MYQLFRTSFLFFRKNGLGLTRFVLVNRLLSAVSLLVDGLMIYLIREHGILLEMAIVIPLFFSICMIIIMLHDFFLSRGHDLLYIEYFNKMRDEKIERKRIFKRFTQWILKRKITIFLLGSLWLEPDITTLILRKGQKMSMGDTVEITLPATVICISFWSVIFYLGLKGYSYFQWFVS